jgi:O-antigen ligase
VAWFLAVSQGDGKMASALRLANYAYLPAALLAIVLTASRGSVFAVLPALLFVVGSLTRLSLFRRTLVLAAIVAVLFALQPLVPQASLQRLATTGTSIAEGDLGGRVNIWRGGLTVFAEHPLLGVGSGAYRVAIYAASHNSFLSVLLGVGIIGLALFALIFAVTIREATRQPKWHARLWLTMLLVLAIGNSVHNWEYRKPTWLFLSLVIASAGLYARRDGATARSEPPVELKSIPREATDEAWDAVSADEGTDLSNVDSDHRFRFRYGTGGGNAHLPEG